MTIDFANRSAIETEDHYLVPVETGLFDDAVVEIDGDVAALAIGVPTGENNYMLLSSRSNQSGLPRVLWMENSIRLRGIRNFPFEAFIHRDSWFFPFVIRFSSESLRVELPAIEQCALRKDVVDRFVDRIGARNPIVLDQRVDWQGRHQWFGVASVKPGEAVRFGRIPGASYRLRAGADYQLLEKADFIVDER